MSAAMQPQYIALRVGARAASIGQGFCPPSSVFGSAYWHALRCARAGRPSEAEIASMVAAWLAEHEPRQCPPASALIRFPLDARGKAPLNTGCRARRQ